MTRPNFNLIARPYRFLEYLTLGPALQRCRTHYIPYLRDRKRALVLGDGDGRFLSALLGANPDLRADAVDTSSTMLHLLSQRCHSHADRLCTYRQSALTFTPQQLPDLLTAHFFFDCLTQSELDALLAKHARPNTLWLVSDFRIPTGFLYLPAKLYVRILYFAFRLLTGLRTTQLPDHETPLSRAGFTRTHQHLSLFGLLATEIWQRL